jgi:4-aminobutyrate aminotransferase
MGALAFTSSKPAQRQGFMPVMGGVAHVPFPDPYRPVLAVDGGDYGETVVRYIEEVVLARAVPPDECAAILVEPIQGEGGVNVAPDGYLAALRRLCDESGALLMFDEIQTGMGRTGRLWGYQNWGVEPDVMTLAKALASGIPIGAMVARESCARVLIAGTHGTTFGGNPFATTVGVATFTTMLEDRLPERADRVGTHLMARLRALAGTVPAIREVRGKGLLVGIEIDRVAGPIVDACRDRGLLILTAGEKILRMTPPLIVDESDADRAVAIVGDALRQAKP